jgi:CheY-like chemotaxis protein
MTGRSSPLVLVVEDNEAIRDNVSELLGDEGYRVWAAETADAALRRLEAGGDVPDLVLLDLFMPGMSAAELVARLRRRPDWARARVVLFTAAGDLHIPRDLRVDALVEKPFDVEHLLGVLRRLCAVRQDVA